MSVEARMVARATKDQYVKRLAMAVVELSARVKTLEGEIKSLKGTKPKSEK